MSGWYAACIPELESGLLGDKARTALFDNSKIRRFVPGYVATPPFACGIERCVAWFDADAARQQIDEAADTYRK